MIPVQGWRRPDGRERKKERVEGEGAPLLSFPLLLSSVEDETRAAGERKNLVMGSEGEREKWGYFTKNIP